MQRSAGALASEVPAIVPNAGGPQFLIDHGETGFVASTPGEFISSIRCLAEEPQKLQAMREAARDYAVRASTKSWVETTCPLKNR